MSGDVGRGESVPSSGQTVEQFVRGRHFTHADVVKLTGVTPTTLQNWSNRRVVEPVVANPGRQGRREYTPLQVAAIGGCLDLIGWGVAPSLAFTLAQASLHSIMQAEAESRLRDLEIDSLPVFHGAIEDYFSIIWGPIRERDLLPVRLVRKNELMDLDFTSRSLVIMPIGRMLVDMAERASALDAGEG
jgi:hypothetical protein